MKKIVLFTIIFMIAISSLSMVSAGLFGPDPQEVTVDGVNFVLDGDIKIKGENDNFINFAVKDGVTGVLSRLINDEDLESYTQNDTEWGYTVLEVNSDSDIKEYGFVDGDISKGYFILFQKDGKNFVYQLTTSLNADDYDVKEMAESINAFIKDNPDLKPI